MTGNIASHTKRRAPTGGDTHISELSLRQPVRLAVSLVEKRSVATDGQLVYASSAAQVISSIRNYRGRGGGLQMRGGGVCLGSERGNAHSSGWLGWTPIYGAISANSQSSTLL